MVPARSHKVPRVSWYSGSCCLYSPFAYGAFTSYGRSSQKRSTRLINNVCSPNPEVHALRFGLFRVRSPLLTESHVVFSSSGYLDVSVHRVPPVHLWIQCTVPEVRSGGFPHSDIHGSRLICSSPWLFAAYHVFLRLSVPRHPPCALSCLTRWLVPGKVLTSADSVPLSGLSVLLKDFSFGCVALSSNPRMSLSIGCHIPLASSFATYQQYMTFGLDMFVLFSIRFSRYDLSLFLIR